MPKKLDLTGVVFGRLRVLHRTSGDRNRWKCLCQCGNYKAISQIDLRRGETKSCGCLRAETAGRLKYSHGNARTGKHTRTYWSWKSMLARCRNKNLRCYHYYGGRGVRVCSRWTFFQSFLEDMGPRPSNTTLDRIDPNGHYEPSNCRWADSITQRLNCRPRGSVSRAKRFFDATR